MMSMRYRHACALLMLGMALSALFAMGCESKMDDKECTKLRTDAFDLLNKGQQCNTDADCLQSSWPGCEKPISKATGDKIKPMFDAFTKGKCEDTKMQCPKPPEAYCKQGLCVHRHPGTPEGAGNTPADQIKVQ